MLKSLPFLLFLLTSVELSATEFETQIQLEEYQTHSIPIADGSQWQFQSRYELPITLDAVESYAKHQQLEIKIEERSFNQSSGGGGCGHSPACIIVLPFYLLDMLTADTVMLDQVSFYHQGEWQIDMFYSRPHGQLVRIKSATISMLSSPLLQQTIIGANQQAMVQLSQQLIAQLPKLQTTEDLSLFKKELSGMSYPVQNFPLQRTQRLMALELMSQSSLSEAQFMTLASGWCNLPKYYPTLGGPEYSPLNLLVYSSPLTQGENASYLLDCVKTADVFSVEQQASIDRLVGLQEQALTQLGHFISAEWWDDSVKQYFLEYLPMTSHRQMTTLNPLLGIYHGWWIENTISEADYITLVKDYPEKSAPLREQLKVTNPHVLQARMTLVEEGILSPLPLLEELTVAGVAIDSQLAQRLAKLYWQDHYAIERFAILPRQDKDIQKQAYILGLLAPLPESLRQALPAESGSFDARPAWDIAILNTQNPELEISLQQRPRLGDLTPSTPQRVSTRVDEHGSPTYAGLIWYALSFHPELYKQIGQRRLEALEEEQQDSWLEKGRSLWEQLPRPL
ncbi:hypothetical protein [Shewanella woodyi]|uniref:hypothetical protein n=1 Tax=Shewanella woodyi TaxID=60961 RepID=UPI0007F8BD11|nr:hypothetical protein [Shewanella woodyi]